MTNIVDIIWPFSCTRSRAMYLMTWCADVTTLWEHYGGVLKRAGGDGGGNAPWWEYWMAQHITHVTQWAVSHDRPLPTPCYRTTNRQPPKYISQSKNPYISQWKRKGGQGRAKENEILVLVKAKQRVQGDGKLFEQAPVLEDMENSTETLMDLPSWSGICTEVSSSPALNVTLHWGSENSLCLS